MQLADLCSQASSLAATCDDETYQECSAIRIWDPDGNELLGQVDEPITVLE